MVSSIYHHILERMKCGEAVVVATIVTYKGRNSGVIGSKIMITDTGEIYGTVGGGNIEQEVIQTAKSLFGLECCLLRSYNTKHDLTATELETYGDGQLEILIESIPGGDRWLYEQLVHNIRAGISCRFIGQFHLIQGAEFFTLKRSILLDDATIKGDLDSSAITDIALHADCSEILLIQGQETFIIENLKVPCTLCFIGARQICPDLIQMAATAGFRVLLIDTESRFANQERYPECDQCIVCNSWEESVNSITLGDRNYVVIATNTLESDLLVLEKVLASDAGYVGMLGNRKKRSVIIQNLLDNGYSRESLDRLRCPAGLFINAETPFETAVGIMAELIKIRGIGERRTQDQKKKPVKKKRKGRV